MPWPAEEETLPQGVQNDTDTETGEPDPVGYAAAGGEDPEGVGDHAERHNSLADAINRTWDELGVDPSGGEATVADRLDAMGLVLADTVDTAALEAEAKAREEDDATVLGEALALVEAEAAVRKAADEGKLASAVFYETHTWTLHDSIAVPAGDTDFLAPMRLKLRENQTCKIVKVEYRCNNGAGGINFTFKLQKNGEDITGFTALKTPAEAAWKETDPEDKTLADNDSIAPVVTAIEGAPKNGSITIVLEHTVT